MFDWGAYFKRLIFDELLGIAVVLFLIFGVGGAIVGLLWLFGLQVG